MGNMLNRIGTLVVFTALGAALMAQPGGGQGRGPGRPHHPPTPAVLLHMNSVRVELKITEAQQKALDALFAKAGPPKGDDGGGRRGGPGGGREGGGGERGGPGFDLKGELEKILNQDQGQRLMQLVLQFDSPFSLVHPRTGEALKLTREQGEAIHEIIRSTLPRPERGQRPDWNEMMKNKALATQKALRVLNQAQLVQWNKMTGKAFTNWEEPKRP